jgi:hypothetical protein
MTDTPQGSSKTAEAVKGVAKQASYVAVGMGILAVQAAKARRQQIIDAAESDRVTGDRLSPLADAHDYAVKLGKGIDSSLDPVIKAVDSALEPLWRHLPEPVPSVVQHGLKARDGLRTHLFGSHT